MYISTHIVFHRIMATRKTLGSQGGGGVQMSRKSYNWHRTVEICRLGNYEGLAKIDFL